MLALLLFAGALSRVIFLTQNCPLDLSADEAQYWDWSRNLDLSYYSKGPAVAWIIRASCALFGDNMPAVRFPSVLIGVGVALCTYWLTARLFKSEKLALGAVVLCHFVPMYIAGSFLMTIDPPFVLCWALATCFGVVALTGEKRWAFPVAGLFVGLGFLAKYACFLWFLGFFLFLLIEPAYRKWLRTLWPYLAVLVAGVGGLPILIWSVRNGWISLKHVEGDITASGFQWTNLPEFLLGQAGLLSPPLFVILIAAIVMVVRRWGDAALWPARYLLVIGGSFFLTVCGLTFKTVPQPNWPGPSWFTLVILAAWYIGQANLTVATWRRWRGFVAATGVIGLMVMAFSQNSAALYPTIDSIHRYFKPGKPARIRSYDPSGRLRGWQQFGSAISDAMADMRPGTFLLAGEYQTAAEMSFYTRGQPLSYTIGTYLKHPGARGRYSQYDLWADRSLEPDKTTLLGKDAIYSGYWFEEIEKSFEHVTKLPPVEVWVNGSLIYVHDLYRCEKFKGIKKPVDGGTSF